MIFFRLRDFVKITTPDFQRFVQELLPQPKKQTKMSLFYHHHAVSTVRWNLWKIKWLLSLSSKINHAMSGYWKNETEKTQPLLHHHIFRCFKQKWPSSQKKCMNCEVDPGSYFKTQHSYDDMLGFRWGQKFEATKFWEKNCTSKFVPIDSFMENKRLHRHWGHPQGIQPPLRFYHPGDFTQPWPSKIPDPWRSPTTISKGHLTIPRRSQRIARVVFWEKKNSTKFVFCFLRLVLDYCYRIFSLSKFQQKVKLRRKPEIFWDPPEGVWCRFRIHFGERGWCASQGYPMEIPHVARHLSVRTVMACFNICVFRSSRRREVFWWVLWFDWFFFGEIRCSKTDK